jgi:LmbE family N-acetylglucosaminyl deacetylase
VDGLDPDVFAVGGPTAAVVFDARPVMDRKLAAFAAHQSAFGVSSDMLRDPPAEQAARLHAFAPIMEQELFTLGAVRGPVPRWPLADLFDGIDLG